MSASNSYVCIECGEGYNDLASHYRWNPECMPCDVSDSDDDDDEEACVRAEALEMTQDRLASDSLRSQVAFDLCTFRTKMGFDSTDIAEVKRAARSWCDELLNGACARLRPLLRPGVSAQQVEAALSRDIFAGLATAKQEEAFVKNDVAFIEPRVVKLGDNEDVASFSPLAVLNLPPLDRFKEENIFLPVLARSSTYKKHGMARVLCGVDSNGIQHDEPNYAQDMRELNDGRWITIPDDAGGTRPVRLVGWNMAMSSDFLAKMSTLPYMESASAHKYEPASIIYLMHP